MCGVCVPCQRNSNGAVLSCEKQCKDIEERLALEKIEIKDLENMIEELSYTKNSLNYNELSELFTKFGISKEEFLAEKSLFKTFYGRLPGHIAEDKGYILSTSLPFCKGDIFDKKCVLWRCLETTEKDFINHNELIDLIKMLIVMQMKGIPAIAAKQEEKIIDKNMKLLVESTEEDINAYATQYFPLSPRSGTRMHRHEFDSWISRPIIQNIFTPEYHRREFICHINDKMLNKNYIKQ